MSLWIGKLCQYSMSVYLKKVTITIIIIYLVAIVIIFPTIHLLNYPSQFVPTKMSSTIRRGLLRTLVTIIFTLMHNYHNQFHLRSWIASGTSCASFSLLALRHHNKREIQRFKHQVLSVQENDIFRSSLNQKKKKKTANKNSNENHTIIPSAPGCPTEPLSPYV